MVYENTRKVKNSDYHPENVLVYVHNRFLMSWNGPEMLVTFPTVRLARNIRRNCKPILFSRNTIMTVMTDSACRIKIVIFLVFYVFISKFGNDTNVPDNYRTWYDWFQTKRLQCCTADCDKTAVLQYLTSPNINRHFSNEYHPSASIHSLVTDYIWQNQDAVGTHSGLLLWERCKSEKNKIENGLIGTNSDGNGWFCTLSDQYLIVVVIK